MNYKLIVIWYTGEKNEHLYKTYEEAQQVANNYKMAFGNQITYTGIIEI